MLGDVNKWLNERKNKSLIIYGAGNYGKAIHSMWSDVNWVAFIDKNKNNEMIEGLKVLSLNETTPSMLENSSIIISNKKEYFEIKMMLSKMGATDLICFCEHDSSAGEYFEDFLPHCENEVFVDAGVYDGKTTLDFVEWSKVYKYIYMFEPSMEYKDRYYKNVAKISNCEWISKGLGRTEEVIQVFDRPDHDISVVDNLSGIEDKYKYQDGKWINIPITSVDKMLNDIDVTFIKMDIEGAEEDALYGCEKTIKKCHPKLAICLYHKIDDPWRLPQIILSFDPTYKFYVRHYSFDMLDTVLYAI